MDPRHGIVVLFESVGDAGIPCVGAWVPVLEGEGPKKPADGYGAFLLHAALGASTYAGGLVDLGESGWAVVPTQEHVTTAGIYSALRATVRAELDPEGKGDAPIPVFRVRKNIPRDELCGLVGNGAVHGVRGLNQAAA